MVSLFQILTIFAKNVFMANGVNAFVIHVRGHEERRQFIQKQLDKLDVKYHFVFEGNVDDITPEVLDTYFKDNGKSDTMYGLFPRTSCAYKHFIAFENIVKLDLPGALILEDDIRLFDNFEKLFYRSLEEYESRYSNEAFIANYEESSLLLVPRSKRVNGQILYPMQRDRFAGCYYINQKAARTILSYIEKEKCDVPHDLLQARLIKQGRLSYYWSYPCLACQCSCDGSMPTMIPTRPRPFKRLKWFYKRFYKHLLYWFR